MSTIINGTSGSDSILIEGNEAHEIHGLDGDDSIFVATNSNTGYYWGGWGNDTLDGGAGNDWIRDTLGSNIYTGGTGQDTLYGGDGDDTYLFNAGDGVDQITDSSDSNAFIFTGVASTTVQVIKTIDGHLVLNYGASDQITVLNCFDGSGSKIDSLQFSDGIWSEIDLLDRLLTYGSSGADTLTGYQEARNRLYGYAGLDSLYGGPLADTLLGGADADHLYGGEGDDTLLGEAGHDTLNGDAGDDTLDGGSGNDELNDSGGNDTYRFSVGSGVDRINDYDGDTGYSDVVVFSDVASTALTAIERVDGHLVLSYGSADQLTVVGYFNDANARIESFKFSDGVTWNDAAIKARVITQGDAGPDSITGYDDGGNRIYGYDGLDYLVGGALADTLSGGNDADTLYGQAGADSLLGGADDDWLYGGTGNDTFNGGTGNDTFNGEAGNDTYQLSVGSGSDRIEDADSTVGNSDVVIFADVTSTSLTATERINDDLVLRYGSDDQLTVANYFGDTSNRIESFKFSDAITWNDAAIKARVITQGDAGTNTINGYDNGSNRIYGYEGMDNLTGGALADTIVGGDDADYIVGLTGADSLQGDAGEDSLYGGSGNDTLNGGSGDDTLNGEAGNDTYQLRVGSGSDRIEDYDSTVGNSDVVIFSDVASSGLTAIERIDSDLVLRYGDSDQLTVANYFNDFYRRIESFKFSDAITWNDAAIKARVITQGNSEANQINGYEDGGNRIYGYEGTDNLTGGALADTLVGGDDADTLYGQAGADSLQGDAGDDALYGGSGNDTCNGGAGNDTLSGDTGNDTYQLRVGSGSDRIEDADSTVGNSDVVIFADVTSSGLTAVERINGDLVLRYGSDDQLTVANYFGDNSARIESFKFSDAATWNDAAIKTRVITQGDASANYIVGYDDGSNRIYGYEGMDNLTGGALADTIVGGDDADYLYGQAGADSLQGDAGEDTISAGAGNDQLYGGADNDSLGAGEGNDTLDGGSGNDTLNGEAGNDTYQLSLGSGTDRIEDYDNTAGNSDVIQFTNVTSTALTALERIGSDLVLRYGSSDQLSVVGYFGDANARIESFKFSDAVTWNDAAIKARVQTKGDSTANTISGYDDGSNRVYGLAGNDTLYGGAQADTLSGGDDADWLYGNQGNDSLLGDAGNDTLYGHEGNDTLNGGTGNDSMVGDEGDDTYYVNSSSDKVIETDASLSTGGTDLVLSTLSSYTLAANVENGRIAATGNANLSGNSLGNILYAGAGNNVLNGGSGSDTASYAYASSAVQVSLALTTAQATGGSGNDTLIAIEHLSGSNYNDTLLGNTGNNQLSGGSGNDNLLADSGNDTLDGGSGADGMTGGDGSDTYVVDHIGDKVIETNADASLGGTDLVLSALASYTLSANVENGRITTSNTAQLTGNLLDNLLYAGAGANVLNGSTGTDTVSYLYASAGISANLSLTTAQSTGGSGSDTLIAIENLTGSNFNDRLTGGTGANRLDGGLGIDTLSGGSGNDTLLGGAGNDTLVGGAGKDSLTGGAGNDIFDFNALSELGLGAANRDVITDFVAGQDKIDLSTIDANTALAGDQAFTLVSSFTTTAGQVRYAGGILYLNTDNDTAAEFEIQLTGTIPTALTGANLVL